MTVTCLVFYGMVEGLKIVCSYAQIVQLKFVNVQ